MMDFSAAQWVLIWIVAAAAYVVFGIAGVGVAQLARPVLEPFMPLLRMGPLLAVLDFGAAATNLLCDGRQRVDMTELKRLLPWMLLGYGMGVVVRFQAGATVTLMVGILAVAYALHALLHQQAHKSFPATFAMPFGLVGGAFSALFGGGGFVYAVYLAGRVEDKECLRATQSMLIGLSALGPLLFFLLAGAYHDSSLLLTVAVLLPAMWGGVWLGRHITLRLTREQFLRILHGIVLASGLALLARYFF